MPTFESFDGTRLHYDIGGDAELPPLVVHAGGPARHPDYLGDLANLTTRRRLYVLHQRGVGLSAPSPTAAAAAWPELAEDIESLRIHLGLETIELLGHSAGTRVALSYAARYPSRLQSLCLVTPPAQWLVDVPDDSAEINSRTRDDAWSARADAHERLGQWYPRAKDLFFAHADARGIVDALGNLDCPVWVVAGVEDGLTGYAPVLAVADLFRQGTSVSIDGAGHYPWIDEPDAFAAALAEFYPTI
jgi:proline iminopeptidase